MLERSSSSRRFIKIMDIFSKVKQEVKLLMTLLVPSHVILGCDEITDEDLTSNTNTCVL